MKDTILDLFLDQVKRGPDRVAIDVSGVTITYAELANRAMRLASRLRAAGAGPERIVAILTEPCPEMVIAILATLWAGSAYLPLDPDYPPTRLRTMLDDARPVVVLATRQAAPRLSTESLGRAGQRSMMFVDDASGDVDVQMAPCPVDSGTLAYVVFTSGSTGVPKGVMITHAGIADMIRAQIALFAITPESRVLQFASFSFDASVSEVFIALAAGAQLCLAPRIALAPGAPLLRTLRKQRITVVTLPPWILATSSPEGLTELATVVSAGEACSEAVVDRWAPGRRFINAYGPSEATVCATGGACVAGQGPPGIGRPLPQIRAYVLDDDLAPVAQGAPGQLFLAGNALARGYLARPGQTAAAFVPDPWSTTPGGRMYGTGDVVRVGTSGGLHYLGRADAQVKIRGYRIELEEIAHFMRSVPEIRDALAMVWTDPQGDRRIVAYAVPAAATIDVDAIRARLRDHLPDFMVPWRVIAVAAWPQTPNGKIDRDALPPPGTAMIAPRADYTPPRDATELALVQIWEEILDRAPIGIDDDFFQLGGNSLLAVRLVERIRAGLDTACDIDLLAERPTILKLAAFIRKDYDPDSTMAGAQLQTARPATVLLRPATGSDDRRLFLFPPVHGSPLCYVPLARLLTTGHAVHGLRAPGLRGERAAPTTIDELAGFYIDAIRAMQPRGPYVLAGWSLGGLVAFEVARQLDAAGEKIDRLAIIETTVPGAAHTEFVRGTLRGFAIPEMARLFIRNMAWSVGQQGEVTNVDYTGSSLKEILNDVWQRLIALEIVPPTTALTYVAALLTLFRNTITAMYSYPLKRRSSYAHDIVVFAAENSHPGLPAGCPTDTWAEFVTGHIDYRRLPGNHFTICGPSNVAVLAAQLSLVLAAKGSQGT